MVCQKQNIFFFADTLKIKCYVGRIIVVKLEIYSICVFYAIFVLSVKNISFNVHENVFRNYRTDLFLNYWQHYKMNIVRNKLRTRIVIIHIICITIWHDTVWSYYLIERVFVFTVYLNPLFSLIILYTCRASLKRPLVI